MKYLLYFFRRYKLASLLNLLGLSIAIALFYLFQTQTEYNRNYNTSLKDYQRTYRVETSSFTSQPYDWNIVFPIEIVSYWQNLPHIEQISSLCALTEQVETEYKGMSYQLSYLDLGSNAIGFWGIRMQSDANSAQTDLPEYILSEKTARRIFGAENPVGKTLFITEENRKRPVTIQGIYQDFPDNSSIKNGLIRRREHFHLGNWSNWKYEIFVRLDDPKNKISVEKALTESFFQSSKKDSFRLLPVQQANFNKLTQANGSRYRPSDHMMSIISILALLVGLFNFTNFSQAQAPLRMRSMITRKVMGASTASLRREMVLENIFLSAVALAGAALLILIFQKSPECMSLVSGDISFQNHGQLTGITLLTTLGIGILSALFSAWYATSIPSALVLKGSFGQSPRGKKLRWIILTGQFVVAFAMTLYALVMTGQTHYIFNADYGFNKDKVLYAQIPDAAINKKDYLKQEITRLPFIKSSSFAANILGNADLYMYWGRGSGNHRISFQALCVDADFLKTMDIKIAKGRDFNPQDSKGAYILNQTMSRKFPWLSLNQPINKNIKDWNTPEGHYPVVGICENYKLTSMRYDSHTIPAAFVIMGPDMAEWGDRNKKIFVRIAQGYDKLEAKKQLEQLIKQLDTEESCEFRFLDEDLQITYEEEFLFIAQVRFFAFICIFITLIGVFCLTLFETEYRRKEIAIRKIMGSTVHEVLLLFAGRYLIPLLAAFVLAAPIGYLISTKWLQNFAEHTPIYWWFFPLAFLMVSTVVVLTVVLQSGRVATENPVNSIKTE